MPKLWRAIAGCLTSVALVTAAVSQSARGAKKSFTVDDDIALAHFGDPYGGMIDPITFSPDGRYFVVDTERGLLNKDRPESVLRIYRTDEVRWFVSHQEIRQRPKPIWILRRATYRDGPVIAQLHWLANSSGFAFLVRTHSGSYQLFLAQLKAKDVLPLTPENQDVTGFEIRSQRNFVYGALSREIWRQAAREDRGPAIVATGRPLLDLLFTADKYPSLMGRWHDLSDLWAVVNGKRFRVKNQMSGRPVFVHSVGIRSMALSPDGHSVITLLTVPIVPSEWASEYLPPYPSMPYRIKAGPQNIKAFEGYQQVAEYGLIDLSTGEVRPLANAPTGFSAGWWQVPQAKWSSSGHDVLLSNTFLAIGTHAAKDERNRPCVAVVDLRRNVVSCLDRLKGATPNGHEENYGHIEDFRFVEGHRPGRVVISYALLRGGYRTVTCDRQADGSWNSTSSFAQKTESLRPLDVSVRQSYLSPPVLVTTDRQSGHSRILLDPNPQLREVELGAVSVFKWKDETGREWAGGLYEPPEYTAGKRYPLVVQTHGFSESEFEPSGMYPTAFAARELAAAGILVLQVPDCPIRMTADEARCNVTGIESAVHQLATAGMVNMDRIGIVGFSRSCYYVLSALTSGTLHFRAASITDGINFGYFEYLLNADPLEGGYTGQVDAVIGAAPFGKGLQQWLVHSPGFNMDRVTTPLQVVANGRSALLGMWEPYAALRLQHKPVDLIVLRRGTHVLTNPGERKVSQGGTVDWFRFWLQGYEDPDPAKSAQYVRWRKMLDPLAGQW